MIISLRIKVSVVPRDSGDGRVERVRMPRKEKEFPRDLERSAKLVA